MFKRVIAEAPALGSADLLGLPELNFVAQL